MKGLFKLKRLSHKFVSRSFYIVFFIAGFLTALLIKDINIIELVKEVLL